MPEFKAKILSDWKITLTSSALKLSESSTFEYSYFQLTKVQRPESGAQGGTGRGAGGQGEEEGGWRSRGREVRDQSFGFLINSVWPFLSVFLKPAHQPLSAQALYMQPNAVVCEYTHFTEHHLKPTTRQPLYHHHERIQEQGLLEGRSGWAGWHDPFHFPQPLCSHWEFEKHWSRPGGEGVTGIWLGHCHTSPKFRPHQWSAPESCSYSRDACQLPDQCVQGHHVHCGPDAWLSHGQWHCLWNTSQCQW